MKDMIPMGLKAFIQGKNKKRKDPLHEMEGFKQNTFPRHVAIIMDGNGRWAKRKQLPRVAGHRQGVEALRGIIETSSQLGIAYLTLFAFSTENWKRPAAEVKALMALLVEFLQREVHELHRNNVRIFALGDICGLPEDARMEVTRAEKLTKENKGLQVNIAINYGSRLEILQAVSGVLHDIQQGKLSMDQLDEKAFSQYLYTKGIPDPDLLIRTSGEYRLSNFLLYQMAYTELVFTPKDVYWPDFTREMFLEAIQEYQTRKRRYGGIDSGEEDSLC